MVGIDVLKSDIVGIAKVIKKIDLAMTDDKISFSEALGLAFEIPTLFKIAKSYKDVIGEIKDLTKEELAEINEFFAIEFDITNDKAEKVVEEVVALIVTLVSTFLVTETV